MPLFVETCGVDGLEKHLQKKFEAHHIGIVLHMNRLGIARRVGIDLLVRWIGSMSVGKTYLRFHNALNLFEIMLCSPETAASKKDVLTALDFKNPVNLMFNEGTCLTFQQDGGSKAL